MIQNNYTEDEHKALDIRLLFEAFLIHELPDLKEIHNYCKEGIQPFINTRLPDITQEIQPNDSESFKTSVKKCLALIQDQTKYYLHLKPKKAEDRPDQLFKPLQALFSLIYLIPYQKLELEKKFQDKITNLLQEMDKARKIPKKSSNLKQQTASTSVPTTAK